MDNTSFSKLIKLSRVMRSLCMLALVGILAAALYSAFALLGDSGSLLANMAGINLYPDRIQTWQLFAIAIVNGVTVFLLCAALFALWEMFSEFCQGNVLSQSAAGEMRKAGKYFLATAVWSLIAHSATVLFATISNPPGERQLAIALQSHQLFPVLLAGVLFAVGHVLSEAMRIDNENKSFV